MTIDRNDRPAGRERELLYGYADLGGFARITFAEERAAGYADPPVPSTEHNAYNRAHDGLLEKGFLVQETGPWCEGGDQYGRLTGKAVLWLAGVGHPVNESVPVQESFDLAFGGDGSPPFPA